MGCCFKTGKKREAAYTNDNENGQDQPLIDGKKSPSNSGKNKGKAKTGK